MINRGWRTIDISPFNIVEEFIGGEMIIKEIVETGTEAYEKYFRNHRFIGEGIMGTSLNLHWKRSSMKTAIRKAQKLGLPKGTKVVISNMYVGIKDKIYFIK